MTNFEIAVERRQKKNYHKGFLQRIKNEPLNKHWLSMRVRRLTKQLCNALADWLHFNDMVALFQNSQPWHLSMGRIYLLTEISIDMIYDGWSKTGCCSIETEILFFVELFKSKSEEQW